MATIGMTNTQDTEPGGLLTEGTAGSTGVSLALVAAALGHRCFIAMPDDVAVEKVKDFQNKLTDFLSTRKEALLVRLRKELAINDALGADLKAAVMEFKQSYR